jgi:LCP family protein required for cell wall assembly
MPTGRKILFIILGILAAALIGGGIYLSVRWNRPMGESLDLPTLTPAAPQTGASTPAAGAAASDQTATAAPTPVCGGPAEPLYLLGIGADERDNTYLYGLGDVTRIARVDFVNQKITILSIPRDLWVEIPDISDHYGIDHGKLNQAYLFGGPGMGYYDGPGGGPGLMARTLMLNFGVRSDYYAAVNMQAFVKIIDALGGIDIYLEHDVDGRPIDDHTEDMGYFNAGQQHLNGSQALRLSRIRKKYNDLTRADNQTLVMCAAKEKLLSPAILPNIPTIASSLMESVQTDVTPALISQLACLLPKVSDENLVFARLPEEMLKPGRAYDPIMKNTTFVYDVDFDEIRKVVEEFQAGTLTSEGAKESGCP